MIYVCLCVRERDSEERVDEETREIGSERVSEREREGGCGEGDREGEV